MIDAAVVRAIHKPVSPQKGRNLDMVDSHCTALEDAGHAIHVADAPANTLQNSVCVGTLIVFVALQVPTTLL